MENNNNNMLMGILSYLGPLVIISYLTSKNDPFVKFHVKQGIILLIIEVVVWFAGMMFWPLQMILWVFNLATLVLSIIGIINVTQGKQKKLPLVGDYDKYINI